MAEDDVMDEPIPDSTRNLGNIEAEYDEKFQQHFVATPEFAKLLTDTCKIIAGAKGSGKTAIMRALTDIGTYRSRYVSVYPVKLDEMKFAQLIEAMKKLDQASKQGLVKIARTAWQNVIGVFVLEAAVEHKLIASNDRGRIRKYLTDSEYFGTAASDKLLGHLERIWRIIAKRARRNDTDEVKPLLGLHAKQQQAIDAFPSDPHLEEYLALVRLAIRSSGKKLLICLDGLDSIVEYTVESRDYVFAGLIDAIYKLAKHPKLDGVVLKALIPKELAHGARGHLIRDLDKIDQYTETIHWNDVNLGVFIKRRLEEHLKAKGRPFEEVWREFFPVRLKNDIHNSDEDSYQYILRHTLFRPRQLLLHVQTILNEWDARFVRAPFRVDPTFIPKVVSETNYKLSEYVVNELKLDFPRLAEFLKSFRGLSSVNAWNEVALRLERYLHVDHDKVGEVFTDLYNYGIFGIAQVPVHDERASAQFAFGFMTRGVEHNVTSNMSDSTLVALAPMFVEYCRCRPSPVGIISPAP
jgi:hypothetical protein